MACPVRCAETGDTIAGFMKTDEMGQPIPTLRWDGGIDGHLVLLDQTRLPGEVVELHCRTVEDVWQAIKRLAVRAAPVIGVAAAYGVCLALRPQRSSPLSSGFLPLEGRAGEGDEAGTRTDDRHDLPCTRFTHPSPNPSPSRGGARMARGRFSRRLVRCRPSGRRRRLRGRCGGRRR